MAKPKIHEFDVTTQIGVDREMTKEEYDNYLAYTTEQANDKKLS